MYFWSLLYDKIFYLAQMYVLQTAPTSDQLRFSACASETEAGDRL